MLKYTLLFLLASCPILLNAQKSLSDEDPGSNQVNQNECDKVFTKSEQRASLKISNVQFEDTLRSILKDKNAFHKTEKAIFRFIISTQSHMYDLVLESGEIRKEDLVKESIESLSNLWLPAIQNGRAVCSYVQLEMKIQKDNIHISIFQ